MWRGQKHLFHKKNTSQVQEAASETCLLCVIFDTFNQRSSGLLWNYVHHRPNRLFFLSRILQPNWHLWDWALRYHSNLYFFSSLLVDSFLHNFYSRGDIMRSSQPEIVKKPIRCHSGPGDLLDRAAIYFQRYSGVTLAVSLKQVLLLILHISLREA